ncbi:TetR family transcriptional regulator [Hydrogenophaga sp. ZJX-1]|uniref:TetR family transcriptional regulator n=1 Tax=Hydrogenophaga sp. ZJX-1 TaxID=3404778 RepID=UPI003B28A724
MVRRTKADAEATRHSLLDAAEHLFQERGVSRTSLNDIAVAAGTTRGAIYWHFKDKADLFNAMMERVTLPLEETLAGIGKKASVLDNPLQPLRDAIAHALHKAATDEQTRRVFEIATLQVEYNDEMHAVRARHLQGRNECVQQTAKVLRSAADQQGMTLAVPVQCAALGLHVMIDGLIQNWLLDTKAFDLRRCGRQVVDTYLSGLGFSQPAARAPRRAAPVHVKAVSDAAPPAPSGSPTPEPSQTETA